MSGTHEASPLKDARRHSVRAFKKSVIVDAAQRVLDQNGIEGATVRAIAKEAGYTPGALYNYYAHKDDILAELLCQSLGRAARFVRLASESTSRVKPSAVKLAAAFIEYYQEEAVEFDLLLTILQSRRISNVSNETSRTLNGRLIAALSPIAETLIATAQWDKKAANEATIQAAAFGLGLLLLQNSNRLSALGMDIPALTVTGYKNLLS